MTGRDRAARAAVFLQDRYILIALGAAGLIRTLITFRFSFGLGDQSTFYSFAKNIVGGEAIYKDFIHFRMPGAYYLYALFLKVFGTHFYSLALATGIESYILYPVLLYISARLLVRSRAIGLVAAGLCVVLPGIFQLRAVLGLLAVGLYCYARRQPRLRWYLGAGVALGVDFVFGQEVFLMAAATIGFLEIANLRSGWLKRIGALAGGTLAIILPFLAAIAIFSNLGNFFYYAFKYALVIQPKFMNLPFPVLSLKNLLFYMPFIIYIGSFAVLYAAENLTVGAVGLLCFGLVRMISALGRADAPHLLFSLPEAFIILPFALAYLPRTRWRRLGQPGFYVRAVLLAVIIAASIHRSSSIMLLGIPVLAFGTVRSIPANRRLPGTFIPAAIAALLFFGIVFQPSIYGSVQDVGHAIKHRHDSDTVDGSHISEPALGEVRQVSAIIATKHVGTLFSYPIEPYYYTLVPHHATRFMTYEAETTPAEQAESVTDLQRHPPALVIMDILQAEALSRSVSHISDYVSDHYQVTRRISRLDYLQILTPKTHPGLERHLVLDMYVDNDQAKVSGYNVENPDGSIINAMAVKGSSARFTLNLNQPAVLETTIVNEPGTAAHDPATDCGQVVLQSGKRSAAQSVCGDGTPVNIDLSAWAGQPLSISLTRPSEPHSLWADPTVIGTQ